MLGSLQKRWLLGLFGTLATVPNYTIYKMLLIKVALKINKTRPNKKVALKIDKTRPN